MRWLIPLALLLLIGCGQVHLVDTDQTRPVLPAPSQSDVARPNIPRSNPPADTPPNYQEPAYVPSANSSPVFVPSGLPGTDLDVPLGDAIGMHHKILTQQEFKLLKHSPIRVDGNTLVGYEETIRFDFGPNSTGKVIFGADNDEIGTFLEFEEHKPIFEYRLQLDRGTFEHYSGREIQVLGHTYVIAEATNKSVSLYGKSVASNLFFDDGEELEANSTPQFNTIAKVTPTTISFTLYADDRDDRGILLSPGEELGKNIGKLAFGTDLMDIKYKGAPQLEGANITFKRRDSGYTVTTETAAGEFHFDLVTRRNGQLLLGGAERLHLTPCSNCIAPDDKFIITTPAGKSHLFTYSSVHVSPNQLSLRDANGDRDYFEFVGTPGKNATTNIVVDGYLFPVKIGAKNNGTGDYNITVEQGFRNGRVEIVLKNGAILRIGNVNGTTLPIQLVVPAAKTINHREQITNLNVMYTDAWHVSVSNVTFVEDKRNDDTFGATPYGTLIHLKRDNGGKPYNVGNDAVFLVPVEPLYGVVMVED